MTIITNTKSVRFQITKGKPRASLSSLALHGVPSWLARKDASPNSKRSGFIDVHSVQTGCRPLSAEWGAS